MQLYVLAHQYAELLDMVEKEGDSQEIKDTLEGLQGELEEKVDNIVKLMRSIEADEKALKAEEERLYNRRVALQIRRESIKTYLEGELLKNKIDKVKTAISTTWIQNNKPSVVIDETAPELKNPEYKDIWVSHPDTLDKTKVYELLKAGKVIPTAELKPSKSIRIR
jgi:hypothetical protein